MIENTTEVILEVKPVFIKKVVLLKSLALTLIIGSVVFAVTYSIFSFLLPLGVVLFYGMDKFSYYMETDPDKLVRDVEQLLGMGEVVIPVLAISCYSIFFYRFYVNLKGEVVNSVYRFYGDQVLLVEHDKVKKFKSLFYKDIIAVRPSQTTFQVKYSVGTIKLETGSSRSNFSISDIERHDEIAYRIEELINSQQNKPLTGDPV